MREKPNNRLDELEARVLFKQVVKVFAEMHKLGFVHRDVKLDNIFLRADGSVRVGDFGSARKVDPSGKLMKGFHGNKGTVSPDMLECKRVVKPGEPIYNGYSQKVDVWSLGACFYWMLTG